MMNVAETLGIAIQAAPGAGAAAGSSSPLLAAIQPETTSAEIEELIRCPTKRYFRKHNVEF
jgi:hypothetical protein